jgi:hypothetical protein
MTYDYHGAVGSPGLNITVFDNRQCSHFEIRGIKYTELYLIVMAYSIFFSIAPEGSKYVWFTSEVHSKFLKQLQMKMNSYSIKKYIKYLT